MPSIKPTVGPKGTLYLLAGLIGTAERDDSEKRLPAMARKGQQDGLPCFDFSERYLNTLLRSRARDEPARSQLKQLNFDLRLALYKGHPADI